MNQSLKKIHGFALFEILVATLILSGVIYAFVAFMQHQDKQIAEENKGKYLAILTNDLIASTLPGKNCDQSGTYKLTQCVDIDEDSKPLLENNGFDVDSAQVHILHISDSHMMLLTLEFRNGAYSITQAALYAQEIFNNLSPTSIQRFSANTPTSSMISYAVGSEYKKSFNGSSIGFYLTIKEDGE